MNFLRSKRLRWLGIGVAAVLIAAIAVKFLLPAEKIRDLALDQARTAARCWALLLVRIYELRPASGRIGVAGKKRTIFLGVQPPRRLQCRQNCRWGMP